MTLLYRRSPYQQLKHALYGWRLRPNTGSFLKDVLFLLVVIFLQVTITYSILGSFGAVDLITPWVVITAIRQRALQATLLGGMAGFVLETRLAVPAGLYVSAYWILVSVLVQVRGALSWRYKTSWFVSYVLATLWLICFEGFVVNFQESGQIFSLDFVGASILKLLVAAGYGMYLSQEWMSIHAEEPVPV